MASYPWGACVQGISGRGIGRCTVLARQGKRPAGRVGQTSAGSGGGGAAQRRGPVAPGIESIGPPKWIDPPKKKVGARGLPPTMVFQGAPRQKCPPPPRKFSKRSPLPPKNEMDLQSSHSGPPSPRTFNTARQYNC